MRIPESAVEAAAKAIFEIRDDAFDVDEWQDLDSTDREPYECQARAALAAARPFIAGAAGLDPDCGCLLRSCIHRPALTEEARQRIASGQPTARQQEIANAVVDLNASLSAGAAAAAEQFRPAAAAFNEGIENFAEAVRRAQQDRGMTR